VTALKDTDQLIGSLTAELRPVTRLRPPVARALLWLAVVGGLLAFMIVRFANLDMVARRLAEPRVVLEFIGTALTGITAVISAFVLSIPGRSERWAALPLPPLLLWLGASGLGCLKNGMSLHGPEGFAGESFSCLVFIAGTSVPLAIGMFWMLRHARPIAPLTVAVLGTLGVAATAAFILQFFHPFDVTVIDLTLHLCAVAIVMAVGTALRKPLLAAA
jgi:hypothetical protein